MATVSGCVSLAALAVKRWTGVQIQQAALDEVRTEAQTMAHKAIAEAEDNLATAKITISSPLVKDAADNIINRLPKVLEAAGVTPARVEDMVHGALGAAQAAMTRTAPAPTASVPAASAPTVSVPAASAPTASAPTAAPNKAS